MAGTDDSRFAAGKLGRRRRGRRAVALLVMLGLELGAARAASVVEAQPPPSPLLGREGGRIPSSPSLPKRGKRGGSFLITFWCGPPPPELDDARAREIAAAGFNVVGAPCEGFFTTEQNRRALDAAARHGLAMWIKDERLNGNLPLAAGWRMRVAQAVADYGDHPALSGFYLIDEPDTHRFADVAQLVRRLRTIAPGRLSYVNLYPIYVPPQHLAAASYEEYVERFLREVQPDLLSYDHYPFLMEKDRKDFFSNLWTIRRAAERHGVPFLLVVLAMPHLSYRDPTEAELAWQIFHALAFGARGISYFTYWTPLDVRSRNEPNFHYGLVEGGKPTLHYFQAARINATLAALAGELTGFESWGVLDSRGEIAAAFPYGPIRAVEGGPVTAGVFVGPDAELAFLLVNRDYRFGVDVELQLEPDSPDPMIFDATTRRWARSAGPFALEPGGARLLRFER
jgi:hypothetical protein